MEYTAFFLRHRIQFLTTRAVAFRPWRMKYSCSSWQKVCFVPAWIRRWWASSMSRWVIGWSFAKTGIAFDSPTATSTLWRVLISPSSSMKAWHPISHDFALSLRPALRSTNSWRNESRCDWAIHYFLANLMSSAVRFTNCVFGLVSAYCYVPRCSAAKTMLGDKSNSRSYSKKQWQILEPCWPDFIVIRNGAGYVGCYRRSLDLPVVLGLFLQCHGRYWGLRRWLPIL